MILLPLTNQPNQTFTVSINRSNGSNLPLSFYMYWNRIAGYWQLSITDLRINEEVLDSLPLVTGDIPYPDLLSQYKYLDLGSAYIVPIGAQTANSPGINDWGTNFALLWD